MGTKRADLKHRGMHMPAIFGDPVDVTLVIGVVVIILPILYFGCLYFVMR